jgi:Tat protein secretion system quality control protein TatD with DNase activity
LSRSNATLKELSVESVAQATSENFDALFTGSPNQGVQ